MMAFYCSLIYIGRIAGYMGLTTDKHKPQALGWFIVGGIILLVASEIAQFLVLGLAFVLGIMNLGMAIAVFFLGGWIMNLFYFIITSMREMVEVVQNIRKAIDELNTATRHLAEMMMDRAVSTALKGKTMDETDLEDGPQSGHPVAKAEFK